MNVLDQVLQYIVTELAPNSEIGPDTNLFCDGYLDSTAMLEVILWIGDTFNVNISNEDLTSENFGTPRNIAEYVQRHAAAEVGSTA